MTAAALVRRRHPRPLFHGRTIEIGDTVSAKDRRGLTVTGEVRVCHPTFVVLARGDGSMRSVLVDDITYVSKGGI